MRREGLPLKHLSKDSSQFSREAAERQRYFIKLRKNQNYAFKHTGNADEPRRYILMCFEITLLTLKVQNDLRLEVQVMKCGVYGVAVHNC
jgi:hypothetical protein